MAVSSHVYPELPVAVAEKLRYYEQESLLVRIEDLQGVSKGVQAMVGGSVDVTCGSFSQVLSLAARGLEVKAFTTVLLGSQIMVVAGPEASKTIRHVQDLRGTTLGVPVPGGSNHQVLNYLLLRAGVSPADVAIVSIGVNATAVAALERNKVTAAAIGASEYLALRRKGLDPLVLVDLRSRDELKRIFGIAEYPTTVLMATGRWLREHPDTAHRLSRAVVRAGRWMHQQAPSAVLENMPARYRGDPEIDLEVITTLRPLFSTTGAMTAEGAQAVGRVMALSDERVRTSGLDLSKTYTNEFVEMK
jgi:NitT/TauT family transport system substrate-binding protein